MPAIETGHTRKDIQGELPVLGQTGKSSNPVTEQRRESCSNGW